MTWNGVINWPISLGTTTSLPIVVVVALTLSNAVIACSLMSQILAMATAGQCKYFITKINRQTVSLGKHQLCSKHDNIGLLPINIIKHLQENLPLDGSWVHG